MASEKVNALVEAARNCNLAEVNRLIAEGVNVNAMDDDGDRALIAAVYAGCVEIVKAILNAPGVNPDVTDENGNTALITATIADNLEMVSILIDAKADVNYGSVLGNTALYRAVSYDYLGAVEVLLAADALVATLYENEWTPLSRAADNGNTDMMNLLIKHGAIEKDSGRSLHKMVEIGKLPIVKKLLDAGADVNEKRDGKSPFFIAKEKYAEFRKLRKKQEIDGDSPLYKEEIDCYNSIAEALEDAPNYFFQERRCRSNGHRRDCIVLKSEASFCKCGKMRHYYKCSSGVEVYFIPHSQGRLHAEICTILTEEQQRNILRNARKEGF